MTPSTITSLLAAEKRQALLADASAFRQSREARQARRIQSPSRFAGPLYGIARRLGAPSALVRIRPIRSTDTELILDGFSRLSVESRWMRFLSAKHNLSARELRFLTEVDHHDHEALVAVSRFGGRG